MSIRVATALLLFSLGCNGDVSSSVADLSEASRAADEKEAATGRGIPIAIAEGERGRLVLGENRELSRYWLELEVHDRLESLEEPGSRMLRVVGVDGRRFDTTAETHPSKADWVRAELEAGFLTPGLYMIEVDAVDDHALDFRRFVLEVTP